MDYARRGAGKIARVEVAADYVGLAPAVADVSANIEAAPEASRDRRRWRLDRHVGGRGCASANQGERDGGQCNLLHGKSPKLHNVSLQSKRTGQPWLFHFYNSLGQSTEWEAPGL